MEEKSTSNLRSYYDIAAGALYLLLSIFLYRTPPSLFAGKNENLLTIFLVLFTLYGIFRIGRGLTKLLKK